MESIFLVGLNSIAAIIKNIHLYAGMSGYNNKTWGHLSSYLNSEEVEYVTGSGPQASIKVSKITTPDDVLAKLSQWTGFNVYKKADVPEHLHFSRHRNNLDVLMVSKGKEMVLTGFGKIGKSL